VCTPVPPCRRRPAGQRLRQQHLARAGREEHQLRRHQGRGTGDQRVRFHRPADDRRVHDPLPGPIRHPARAPGGAGLRREEQDQRVHRHPRDHHFDQDPIDEERYRPLRQRQHRDAKPGRPVEAAEPERPVQEKHCQQDRQHDRRQVPTGRLDQLDRQAQQRLQGRVLQVQPATDRRRKRPGRMDGRKRDPQNHGAL
ncbi:putative lipoprotein, partial [Pseudomonas sp. FEN]